MTPTTFSTMLKFTPDALSEVYIQKYAFEQGERKLQEVIHKIEDSNKANQYIDYLVQHDKKPTPKDVQLLMNSITYFMFSKAETLCLGGLTTILLWKVRSNYDDKRFSDDEIIEICANFILDISKTKASIGDTFFGRFFNEIDKIGREEE